MLSSANGSFVVKRRKRLDHSRINDVLSPLCSQEIVQKKNASVWKSETPCLFLREHERLGGFQRRKGVYALFWFVCQAIFWALPKIMPIPKNAVRFVFMRSFCLPVKRILLKKHGRCATHRRPCMRELCAQAWQKRTSMSLQKASLLNLGLF